jgi:hypothetical protein
MKYVLGQIVLNNSNIIDLIKETTEAYEIWIKNSNNEIIKWKQFNKTMPISVEFNINF